MQVAIIGGGLTGCLAALAYADRGHGVVLFESAPALLSRASTANEGKIHLGYVYGADASFRTAARMIEDALQFRPILERCMSAAEFESCLCEPFVYVVPANSALPLDAITAHFSKVDAHIRARSDALKLSYLGQTIFPHAVVPPTEGLAGTNAFLTPERGVWPPGISAAVARSVQAHPRIAVQFGVRVHRAVSGRGWRVEFFSPDLSPEGPFDLIVNTAWADRRSIDQRSGFPAAGSWFTRYKFGVVLEQASRVLAQDLPVNTTATLGSFGDCIYYPQNDTLYSSWYPVGMCFSTLGEPGERPVLSPAAAEEAMRRTWEGCASFAPSLGRLAALASPLPARLLGDFIMARGQSDIDDPHSGLHRRNDHGPQCLAEGYWSVETGKYTSAPRCALACVAESLGEG